jgi:hypothetical protein
MVIFLIIFAIGIAVLLAVQAMDIECQRPRPRSTKTVPSRATPAATGLRTFNAIRAAR